MWMPLQDGHLSRYRCFSSVNNIIERFIMSRKKSLPVFVALPEIRQIYVRLTEEGRRILPTLYIVVRILNERSSGCQFKPEQLQHVFVDFEVKETLRQ